MVLTVFVYMHHLLCIFFMPPHDCQKVNQTLLDMVFSFLHCSIMLFSTDIFIDFFVLFSLTSEAKLVPNPNSSLLERYFPIYFSPIKYFMFREFAPIATG